MQRANRTTLGLYRKNNNNRHPYLGGTYMLLCNSYDMYTRAFHYIYIYIYSYNIVIVVYIMDVAVAIIVIPTTECVLPI